MSKIKDFVKAVDSILENRSYGFIKLIVGDSLNNHRVPTVRQVERYLIIYSRFSSDYFPKEKAIFCKELATQLATVYNSLQSDIIQARTEVGIRRSDAIDINEFLAYVENSNNNKLRKVL